MKFYFDYFFAQGAASEQMIVSMMAARNDAISKYVAKHPNVGKYEAMSKLIGYVSKEVCLTLLIGRW